MSYEFTSIKRAVALARPLVANSNDYPAAQERVQAYLGALPPGQFLSLQGLKTLPLSANDRGLALAVQWWNYENGTRGKQPSAQALADFLSSVSEFKSNWRDINGHYPHWAEAETLIADGGPKERIAVVVNVDVPGAPKSSRYVLRPDTMQLRRGSAHYRWEERVLLVVCGWDTCCSDEPYASVTFRFIRSSEGWSVEDHPNRGGEGRNWPISKFSNRWLEQIHGFLKSDPHDGGRQASLRDAIAALLAARKSLSDEKVKKILAAIEQPAGLAEQISPALLKAIAEATRPAAAAPTPQK